MPDCLVVEFLDRRIGVVVGCSEGFDLFEVVVGGFVVGAESHGAGARTRRSAAG